MYCEKNWLYKKWNINHGRLLGGWWAGLKIAKKN